MSARQLPRGTTSLAATPSRQLTRGSSLEAIPSRLLPRGSCFYISMPLYVHLSIRLYFCTSIRPYVYAPIFIVYQSIRLCDHIQLQVHTPIRLRVYNMLTSIRQWFYISICLYGCMSVPFFASVRLYVYTSTQMSCSSILNMLAWLVLRYAARSQPPRTHTQAHTCHRMNIMGNYTISTCCQTPQMNQIHPPC